MRIFLDMDGTLCNFIGAFKELSKGIHPTEYENKHGKNTVFKLIDPLGAKYWADMDWLPEGKKLYNYVISNYDINDVYILSAPSRENSSRIGKMQWIKKHTPEIKKNNIILDKYKYKYIINDKDILIDDMEKYIKPWVKHGGTAIKFENNFNAVKKELKELKKIMENKLLAFKKFCLT
jgi:5'(3')-deoxyribonucleotidase